MDNTYQNQIQGFTPQNQTPSNFTPFIIQKMKGTATWMNVIGIILIIFTALIFILAAFILTAGSKSKLIGLSGGVSTAVAIVYIIFAVLFYLIPGILLIAHANKLRSFSLTNNLPDFEDAISKGKTFWTYTGVLALIVTILFFIVIIVSIAAGS